ncbi:MAG: peptidyl-tRNA hydrolase Pth2 [Methanomicrobia archaeon]|nr:peptidyl-tRNA hydrolase Pth2 [Methanomicrobia archaeon]MCK4309821.1 peptidyl-tRNA hydrolase Pth2 [Methanomicrobia archaeon]MCK4433270.1 peptidyl-tRNA hydrolase Pth2 [Methanomicrobia archaeon]MCK4636424.1 peptidyl-tRNA hydrolase Pth2 [Methanomicrobia archaeon]
MKQVIAIRADLKLGKGKIASQVAHASLTSAERCRKKYPDVYDKWVYEGQKKIVLKIENKKKLLELYEKAKRKIPTILIKDAGMTQISPETITCIGIGPWKDEEIDEYTGNLKLL